MVEARHNCVRSRSFRREPVEAYRRRNSSHGASLSLLFAGLVVTLMSLALLITARQAEVARVGYEIVGHKKELAALQGDYQRLEVAVARLQSFDRIEAQALKLGMKKPTETRLVYSTEPEPVRQPVQVASKSPGLRDYLAQVSATIARIASGVMGAEARTLK